MSRLGKKPVTIPQGVEVTQSGQQVKAKGKLGELSVRLDDEIIVKIENGQVLVEPRTNSRHAKAMWSTTRSHIRNIITGVTEGFKIDLEINGVGYRAAVQGQELVLQLGFSHEIRHKIPQGITVKCEKPTSISLHGINKEQVGQLAADIRSYRPPEPYKGKGVKYADEYILRKEGKKK